jgi:polyisoprenoid-binding protein YceI
MGVEWGGGYRRPPRKSRSHTQRGTRMQNTIDISTNIAVKAGERLVVSVEADGTIRASHYNAQSERLGVLRTVADLRVRGVAK